MRPSLCRSCLAIILKFLIFLQTFVGLSIIIYSVWLLDNWRRNGLGNGFDIDLDLDKLPAPWFVCAVMGIGVLLCVIAFIGHVAAETINGCCLCFYSELTTILILLEAALIAFVLFRKHWEEDLPYDSTGELKRLCAFVKANVDVCKWVGTAVVVIQALSLLLAMTVRVLIPSRRVDYDSDKDFVVIRRPLLHPQAATMYIPSSVDSKDFHLDYWSFRKR